MTAIGIPNLTAKERIDLIERMDEELIRMQGEWGKSWQEIRDEVEKDADTIISNQ